MNKVNPHKSKYFDLYMDLAIRASEQSVATRRQVGAVIVTSAGVIAIGWNGTAPGFDNVCEYLIDVADTRELLPLGMTKPEVIHAERNALDKLSRQGISPEGSILFVTTAPCIECAKSIAAVGIDKVVYLDTYKTADGIDFLKKSGVDVQKSIKE